LGRRIAALVRHGDYYQAADVPSAHQPYPLNANGEQHARQAVDIIQAFLQQNNCGLVSLIDSSQMLRAWQTASIIADGFAARTADKLHIECFDELAERGVGSAANLTIRQIEKILQDDPRYASPPPQWKSDSHYRLPFQGAESLLEAGVRVAGHIVHRMNELPVDESAKLKLFVGHGAAFRHAAYKLGVMAFDDIARLSMYHGQPVFLEIYEDGHWRHIDGEWKVRASGSAYID
jgi:2,3-bisphosphoglycerate-dependent phosphoglycerate mutase